jgi:Flp pilus assembly protein TadG
VLRLGRSDRGSAVVEFVLVVPLLLALAVGVLQVVLTLHVRSVATAAAAEGARAAALAGADPATAVARVEALLDGSLTGTVVREVSARPTTEGGLALMVVRVDARIPLAGLLVPADLVVEGRALREGA